MPAENGARSGSKVDWAKYAEDARDLFLTTSLAAPTAMRVWITAWCDWATSAAKTQEQLARRWNQIVQNPSRGGTVLDEMRNDVKRYILDVGGIPERAVLDFLVGMEGSPGKRMGSADKEFVKAAESVVAAAADALNLLEQRSASYTKEAQPSARGRTEPTAADGDPLAELREKMSRLNAVARTRLKEAPESPPE